MLEHLSAVHSEALARALFACVPGGVLHVRADGSIAAANAEALRLFDLDDDRGTWRNVTDLRLEMLREDDGVSAASEHPIVEALKTGVAQPERTLGLRRPDGTTAWIVVRALPVQDPQSGTLLGALATFVDITERKRAEQELRRSRELLRKAQELAQVGAWEWELASGDVRWTDQMHEIHGLDKEHFVGKLAQARDFVHPDDRQRVRAYHEQLFTGNGRVTVPQYRIVRPDGTERCVWCSAELLRDPAGRPVKIIGAVQDITERQQVETRLRHLQRLESIGQLAGGIAHDFNNLLQPIINAADTLLRGSAPRAHVLEIRAAAMRGARLSRQLLAFARRQPFQPCLLDLNWVIEEFASLLRRSLGSGILVETALATELDAVVGDRGQLEQVLMNLALNARDAMPQGGRLRIETRPYDNDHAAETSSAPRTRRHARFVKLSVHDTGVGMNAEVQATAFDPFFTTKAGSTGTGLGLAVVQGIVERHGGRIAVESQLGQGTTFHIYLPASAEAARSMDEVSQPAEQPSGDETLLIVDDDAAVLRSTHALLRSANYRVLTANSADTALAIYVAHAHEINLVVTDMLMPRRSGVELVDEIRRHRPDARALFLTGCAPADAGPQVVDPILTKPYAAHELLAALRSALDRPADLE